MKIIYTTGCIADSLTIDGKESIDYTADELRAILHSIVGNLSEAELQGLLIEIVERHCDDYECSGQPCSQCGDTTQTYTIDVPTTLKFFIN